MKTTAILAGALFLSAATPALAGEDWKGLTEPERNAKVQEKFVELDTNKDGVLSEDEFTSHAAITEHDFERADLNDNGTISVDELKAFKEAKLNARSAASSSNERMSGDGSRTSH